MTRACALEINKLEKKRAAVFLSCSPLPSSSTQSLQSCCIATTKWGKIFLTSRLFIWCYCGVNILTIRRFYGFIPPHLRPVVEAEEDGGDFKLPNSTNFRLRWIQGVRRTYFQNKDWHEAFSFTKSSLIKASCRPESSKRLAAGFFAQSGSMFTSQYTQRVAANRVSALSQFSSLLR